MDRSRLERAGIPVASLPAEQLSILDALTDDELRVLTDIQQRVDAFGDVEGHDSGGTFW